MQLQRPVLAVQYLLPRAQSVQEVGVFEGKMYQLGNRAADGGALLNTCSARYARNCPRGAAWSTVSAEATGQQHVAHVRVLSDDTVLVDGIVFVEPGP